MRRALMCAMLAFGGCLPTGGCASVAGTGFSIEGADSQPIVEIDSPMIGKVSIYPLKLTVFKTEAKSDEKETETGAGS